MLLALSLSSAFVPARVAQAASPSGAPEPSTTNGTPTASAGTAPAPPQRIVEVRVALSPAAAESLSEPYIRRLLELELDESAVLAPGTSGPLGDHVAYIWIDLPSASKVAIEVRVGDRAVARREIGIAGGAWDVAARIVAITASEMVRTQMRPVRAPRRPPPPRRPTPEEIEIASRTGDAVTLSAAARGAFVPSDGVTLVGPVLALTFRRFGISERLSASWLSGPTPFGLMRWLEAGVGVDYRFRLSRSWRLALGVTAAAAALHLSDVRSVDGVASEVDTWSARAGGEVGLEAWLGGPVWLGLALEPGAVLRPVRYEGGPAGDGMLAGAWLAVDLSLALDWRLSSRSAPGGRTTAQATR